MASPRFHEITKQASFFFKDKIIKSARLAVTDVTSEELLTEEVTSSDSSPPDARSMSIITRASFEVDQFERIVKILRKRLSKFDRNDWRGFYNALILLNHLLVHGPMSVAKEFQHEKDVIEEVTDFQCIDAKGINCGLKVKNLSERVRKLLEDDTLHKQERERYRKLTVGKIVGFGGLSFKHSSSGSYSSRKDYERSHSLFNDRENDRPLVLEQEKNAGDNKDHPFVENELKDVKPLLSSPT
ncbi:PREDICTED: epsin-3 [Tarenaya hassleriana]|uniref:epsin-3 n=1 Tax=Tarenaya hassleriana TaxID=28532 RepID=UPI00053C652E|nr:PREDICTED: epsin-3 [Tarenaya hassleriana]